MRETEEQVKQRSERNRVTEEKNMPKNGLQRKVDYTIKYQPKPLHMPA